MNLPIDSFITTLSYFLLRKGQNKNFYLELLTAQNVALQDGYASKFLIHEDEGEQMIFLGEVLHHHPGHSSSSL